MTQHSPSDRDPKGTPTPEPSETFPPFDLKGLTVLCRGVAPGIERLFGALNALGITVVQRTGEIAFLKAIRTTPPDVILLNLRSPELLDMDVAFKLEDVAPQIPKVAIGRPEDHRFALAMGATEFIALSQDRDVALSEIQEKLRGSMVPEKSVRCQFDPQTCAALKIQALRGKLQQMQQASEKHQFLLNQGRNIKTDLMHAISSEFIAPLFPITLYLQMVRQGKFHGLAPERQMEALDHAIQCGETIRHLINAIQDFAALDQDPQNALAPERFPLRQRLEKIMDNVRFGQAKPKHVTMRMGTRGEGIPESIKTQGNTVSKVISALLSNAVRRSKDGTMVYLEVANELDEGQITFNVFDEGQTPDEESILQMTDLYRARSSYDRLTIADLQMPTAKRQAELLGGKLTFHSPPFKIPTGQHGRSFGFCQTFTLPLIQRNNWSADALKEGDVRGTGAIGEPQNGS